MPRGVRARGFADELERDLSLEPGVERSIDDTHAALPEQREDLERADACVVRRRRGVIAPGVFAHRE
jgi:hypothetical protein